jgi:hypothetical protein
LLACTASQDAKSVVGNAAWLVELHDQHSPRQAPVSDAPYSYWFNHEQCETVALWTGALSTQIRHLRLTHPASWARSERSKKQALHTIFELLTDARGNVLAGTFCLARRTRSPL